MKLNEIYEEAEEIYTGDLANFQDFDGTKIEIGEPWRGNFYCDSTRLTSLKHGPHEVIGGVFDCSKNLLTSLKYGPKIVNNYNYYCTNNKLTNLIGAPEKCDEFDCHNNRLTSLEGAPKNLNALYCMKNKLTSLHNIHKQIESLEFLNATGNKITSCVLGLLKIKNLQDAPLGNDEINKKVTKIIHKYLPLGNIIECQSELIEAGFEEYAQL
jgi:hypothetical protein